MRPLLIVFTIGFIIAGFFVPLVWVLAVISAVSAIVSSSDSLEVNARVQTSAMKDDNVISHQSKSCPACLGTVSSYASKCQFCGEILEVSSD